MSTYKGNSGVVDIDGTPIVELVSWQFQEDSARLDDTVLGDANKTAKAGSPEVTGSFVTRRDDADAGQALLSNGAAVTIKMRPRGTGSTLPEIEVPATILSVAEAGEYDAIMDRTYSWEATGAVDRTAQV